MHFQKREGMKYIMERNFFGTDGVRGVAGTYPLDAMTIDSQESQKKIKNKYIATFNI